MHLRWFGEDGLATTPIGGLYQCSSATDGGGGVTGIPGLLCTRRILKDTKRNRLRRRGD